MCVWKTLKCWIVDSFYILLKVSDFRVCVCGFSPVFFVYWPILFPLLAGGKKSNKMKPFAFLCCGQDNFLSGINAISCQRQSHPPFGFCSQANCLKCYLIEKSALQSTKVKMPRHKK